MTFKLKHLLLLCLACTTAAYADYDPSTGTYQACVTYQRADYTWSKSYKVRGFIIEGHKLNQIAQQYGYSSNYEYSKNYYVIPWDEGGYSALELDSFEDEPPMFEKTTKDQSGKTWKIKDSWDFCY